MTAKKDTTYLFLDNYNLQDYIILNLKKYLETIKEFKGICINPNTKKPLNDDDIKDLQEQLKYKLLCDIEKIFIKMNTNLTDFYMKNKKNRVQK